jgi:2-oxoglutarate dehydrogenase E2 component (dihydrolipoamide succinyltransferase)
MAVELKVPTVGESITEVQIGQWLKGEGQTVAKDENLVEIETDKATVEIVAPIAGTISKVLKKSGDTATVGEVIGYMEPGVAATSAQPAGGAAPAAGKQSDTDAAKAQAAGSIQRQNVRPPEPGRTPEPRAIGPQGEKPAAQPATKPAAMPQPAAEAADGNDAAGDDQALVISPEIPRQIPRTRDVQRTAKTSLAPASRGGREEEVVPMSPIRRRIAQRLVEAQHNAALLTTFNEVDMSAVMALRSEHKGVFEEKYGIKLGFMSFFVKAAIDALKLVPGVNAEIRDTNIVYHNYFDIGIAVGGGKGLVVPVLRDADRMSFADIELTISDLATRARKNALQLEELQGGTFTISNGGVYGSLLSTPIVNPPQSGILGLHTIQERPVARDGQVVIRPMMYLALTYDHRVVDGQAAVTFLKRVKEVMEEPMRMLVEV